MAYTAAEISVRGSSADEIKEYITQYIGEPFVTEDPKSIMGLFISVYDLTYELNYTKSFLEENKLSDKEEDRFLSFYNTYDFDISIDFALKPDSVLKSSIMSIVFNIALDLSMMLKKEVLVYSGSNHLPYVAIEKGNLKLDFRES
ncbi:MAG: hypothetical protein AAF632_29625 [Bacteroidota bacterium]